jgi:hypothetical protein
MDKKDFPNRQGERGGARAKFIIVMAVFAIVVYVGYLYVPVAYDAYYFKDVMQNKVDMAATQGASANLTADGPPEQVVGRATTANFFNVLGVRPMAGRVFTEEEDRTVGVAFAHQRNCEHGTKPKPPRI